MSLKKERTKEQMTKQKVNEGKGKMWWGEAGQ